MIQGRKIRICILFGGVSPEHEVSLSTATSILNNIDRSLFEVFPVGITKDGKWYLYTGDLSKLADGTWETPGNAVPAFIRRSAVTACWCSAMIMSRVRDRLHFPALHGENGEDGAMQGSAELPAYPVSDRWSRLQPYAWIRS